MPALARKVETAVTNAVTTQFTSLAADNRPEPRTPFDFALRDLLDDLFAAQPTWATHIGFHAYDDRWPDMTEAGRHARVTMVDRHRAAVQALDDASLADEEKIDCGIVLEALDAIEFEETDLREPAWNPLSYVLLAGGGFFGLLAREFAPWEHRGAAFVGRLQGLPALLESGADALAGADDRPV